MTATTTDITKTLNTTTNHTVVAGGYCVDSTAMAMYAHGLHFGDADVIDTLEAMAVGDTVPVGGGEIARVDADTHPDGFAFELRRFATGRERYFALFGGSWSAAVEAENAALSIGRDLLPAEAIAVLDGEEPTEAYWTWLAGQV